MSIRELFFVGAILAFGPVMYAQQPVTSKNGKHAAVPMEVLVGFRARPGNTYLSDLHRKHDLLETKQVGSSGKLYRLKSKSKHIDELRLELSADPAIAYVEPNYYLKLLATVPNDPSFGQLWALQNQGQTIGGNIGTPGADIHATLAWDITKGSRSNVLAIVDTGIDYTHEDLAANIWSAPTAFTVTIGGVSITCPAGSHGFNAVANTCDPMDDHDHGTHVTGIAAAAGNNGIGVAGVNWTASVMGIKVFDSTFTGTVAQAINGISFATQVKQLFATTATPVNIRVLSNSYELGGFSQAFLDAINSAAANNMLFVAAAGNNNQNIDVTPFYPASYNAENIIAVAATTNTDTRASFSNYGATSVDIGAPGQDIFSTVRANKYLTLSGTSMATPQVSGTAMLVLANCGLNTAALKSAIMSTVDPLPTLAGLTVSGGRVNANNAVRSCAAADFTVTASPASVMVAAGNTATYTVTVTGQNGFAGAVAFSAVGLPPGATYQFAPGTVTGSGTTTLTVNTAGNSSPGVFNFSVVGTSASLVRSGQTSLTVDSPPGPMAVSPASGSGASQKFTLAFSDADGYANITGANMLINQTLAGVNACWVYIAPAANQVFLARDDASNWDAITLGSAATLQNSQCSISGSGSSLSGSGSTLTVNLAVSFTSSFVGGKTVFLNSQDAVGLSTGYQAAGTWTVGTGVSNGDFSIAVSPTSQTVQTGASTTYTVSIGSLQGFTGTVALSVSGLPSGVTATFTPASVTASGTSSLVVSASSAAAAGTYPFTVVGTSSQTTHSAAASVSISSSVPVNVSVSPSSGTGRVQSFTFVYSDPAGATDISFANVLINSSLAGTNACWIAIDPRANLLYLANNAGSAWSAMGTPGGTSLQNSQCTISGNGSSIVKSGTTLTVTLAITFQTSFAGNKTVFMRSVNANGSAGYERRGAWTVPNH